MTVLLVLASIFWALFFAYPWIDMAMGNNGWLEHKFMNWLYDFAEENDMVDLFAPIDFEQIIRDLRSR